jgi:DNA-binding transcriptional regulator YiaG
MAAKTYEQATEIDAAEGRATQPATSGGNPVGLVGARPRLSGSELADALRKLGLSPACFAELLDVGRTTVYRWCHDQARVPGYISLLARLLLTCPDAQRAIKRPELTTRGRPRRVKDGTDERSNTN